MPNIFDEFDNVPVAAPVANPFDEFDPPSKQQVATPPGKDGAFQTVKDFSRAAASSATFGLADWLAAALKGTTREQEDVLSAEARNRSPYASLAGDVAGGILPGAGVSAGVARAIPALGRATLPSIIGNQAATGGLIPAITAGIRGDIPDIKDVGLGAGIGGIAGGLIGGISRAVSPSARVRASGSDLTAADKAAMTQMSTVADEVGVPLTIPELARASAPGRAARVTAEYNAAAQSPKGSQVIADFNAGRAPGIGQAGRDMAALLGPGVEGSATKRAAEEGIENARSLVRNSAEPDYAASRGTLVRAPRSAAITEARQNVLDNPIKMEDIGNAPRHSIRFLDSVKKELDAMYTRATGRQGDPDLGRLIRQDKDALTNAMDQANPRYATARNTFEHGMEQLVEPLEAGPLGAISRTSKVGTQSKALFDVATPEAADAAINAAKRLPADIPAGLLSTRISEATSRSPMGWGSKTFPTPESLRVAEHALERNGMSLGPARDTMRSVAAVDPTDVAPIARSRANGPIDWLWSVGRDLPSGGVARRMQDPSNIQGLGEVGPVQGLMHMLSMAAGENVVAEQPLEINVTKKRRRR